MIEFTPMPCLFCPYRKKMALVLKLLLVFGAVAFLLILSFPPRSTPISDDPALGNRRTSRQALETLPQSGSAPAVGDSTKKSLEIQDQAQKKFVQVQEKLKSILNSGSADFNEARKLLQSRQKEVLKEKIVHLGNGSLLSSRAMEAEKNPAVQLLERELKILSEQLELLKRMDVKE